MPFRFAFAADWRTSLNQVVELVREMSQQTDPQEMVRAYGEKIRSLLPIDARLSLSRRGLSEPEYRITRSTRWRENINPWKQREKLPLLRGGLLADLLYANEPVVLADYAIAENDPAAEYLADYRSLMAIPMFDQGKALNMVVIFAEEPGFFSEDQLPGMVWLSNLFGRATNTLVLTEELQRAYQTLDRELRIVGDIQRTLLPEKLPEIPTLDLAAYYQPAARAGGDYYDFFPLPDNRWGIFIGDVSGHGTPAAVMMAVTHCMAHTHPGPPHPPADVLRYLNEYLFRLYTNNNPSFITAFYAVYDANQRTLTYACAGHNPPRLKRCSNGKLLELSEGEGIPLGIMADSAYTETTLQLERGDQIIFYTDGITEAGNLRGELFGTQQLDQVLENCSLQASSLLEAVLQAVADFAEGLPADDDRTLVVARVK